MRASVLGSMFVIACSSTSTPLPNDGGVDAAQSEAGACACRDGFNVDKSSTGGTLGLAWLAWRYVPTCSFAADTVDIATDATTFGIFTDALGLPGAQLVPDVPADVASDRPGFRRATFAAATLSAGTPVWIGIKANPGGIDSTTAPFAPDGAMTVYTSGGPGAWNTADSKAAVIFEVRGTCK